MLVLFLKLAFGPCWKRWVCSLLSDREFHWIAFSQSWFTFARQQETIDSITVEDEALLPDETRSMPVSVLGGLHQEGNHQSQAGAQEYQRTAHS